MTTPTGAAAAQKRNAAAVDQLEQEASVSVRAAVGAMLAEVLAANGDVTDPDLTAPVADTLAAAARRAWASARDRILAWVRDTFGRLLTRAADNLPDDLAPDLPPATVEERVQVLVDEIATGLDGVPDTVAARVTRTIGEGYARGESPDQLRQRVAKVLGVDEWDPMVTRITRTTTTSVYNAAHMAAIADLEQNLGRPLQRMWLATNDSRTRPTHREASTQVVDPGELFKVGDARLRFPGDPLGPDKEIILCRCVVVPVVDDMVVDLARRAQGKAAAVLDTDQPLAAGSVTAATRMPPQFVRYWTVGAGGLEIAWDTEGDFTRCTRALRKYLDVGEINGACANLHKLATGRWPAEKGTAADADQEGPTMPCPCETDEIQAAATPDTAAPADPVTAGVSGDPDLPIGPRDMEWDGDAAADRVREWAIVSSDDEGIDVERYASAFFWQDPDADPATETAYKLGFGDVVGEDLVAVPAGIFAAAAAVEGARGGVDIPESDIDEVRARISHYYTRMATDFDDEDLIAPWDRAAGTPPDDGDDDDADGGEAMAAADLSDVEDMAIIALLPSEADAARIALGTGADGETALTADQLHVTLALLGEAAPWEGTPHREQVLELANRIGEDMGPITARLWAAAVGNGNTDDPCAIYLAGDDTGRLAMLQGGVLMGLAGIELVPEQHSPWVAHLSIRYGDGSLDGMDAVGTEVVLDRLRVEIGGEATDFPLSGDDTLDDPDEDDDGMADVEDDTALEPAPLPDGMAAAGPASMESGSAPRSAGTPQNSRSEVEELAAGGVNLRAAADNAGVLAEAAANAPERPLAGWFEPIQVDGPTPPTVTAQGRVWGHVGQAGKCHAGITDECVTVPPTRTSYGAFHREDLVADDGTEQGVTVRVGYLYTGCDHSPMDATIDQARTYLDAACTRTAAGRVYDTEWGPMFVGALMPGVTAGDVARLWKLSGEWFTAPLELHAAVGVKDGGFEVDGTDPDGVLVSDADPEPAAVVADATSPAAGPDSHNAVDVVVAHRARATARETAVVVDRAVRTRKNRAAAAVAGYVRRGQ